jgi:hypothetical protein
LSNAVPPSGCTVLSGVLHDPYTGRDIQFNREEGTDVLVQIDHVVPPLDAWQTGAQEWDQVKRTQFANDPLDFDHHTVTGDRSTFAAGPGGVSAGWGWPGRYGPQGVPGSISISASFFQPVYAILISVGVSTLVVATVTLFSTMLITVSGPALARKLLGPPPIAESK